MSKENTVVNKQGGIGFLSLLTLIFITLKLCKVITWSWFWVLSPTLLPILLFLGAFILFGTLYIIAKLFNKLF
jgi:hypothetical protein